MVRLGQSNSVPITKFAVIPDTENRIIDNGEKYKNIYSQVLQEAGVRIDKAYQNFFRRVRQGKKQAFHALKDVTSMTVLRILSPGLN